MAETTKKRNAGGAISYSRGVIIKTHPTGFDVHMYIDDPGTYLDGHGTELPAKVAKAAGFHTDRELRAKELNKQRAAAESKIQAELGKPIHEVVYWKGIFRLVHVGNQMFHVENLDGDQITMQPLNEAIARSLMDDLTSGDDEGEGGNEVVPEIRLKGSDAGKDKDGDGSGNN